MNFIPNGRVATRSIEWTFKNVSRATIEKHDVNERIVSKPFIIRIGANSTEWSFYAYYCRAAQGLKFHLVRLRSTNLNFRANFSLQLNDIIRDDNSIFAPKLLGWHCYIRLDELFDSGRKHVDENGCLKFIAKIKLTEIEPESTCNEEGLSSDPVVKLYESFCDYINDEKYSDFILICSDRIEIFVHRLILAKKSQVFAKMFDIEMFEKHENKAFLGDINSKTMYAVLHWMYTGTTSPYDVKLATSVLYAAEKYQLFELKCHCIHELMRQIDKENALEILRTADMYVELELQEMCLSMILLHYNELKKTKKWKQLKIPLLMKILDAAHSEASHWSTETVL